MTRVRTLSGVGLGWVMAGLYGDDLRAWAAAKRAETRAETPWRTRIVEQVGEIDCEKCVGEGAESVVVEGLSWLNESSTDSGCC